MALNRPIWRDTAHFGSRSDGDHVSRCQHQSYSGIKSHSTCSNWSFHPFFFFPTFYMDKLGKIHRFRWKVICWKLTKIYLLNPSHPEIKIWILICCRYLFPTEVGREFDKISSKFILSDHVRDSHDHSVLQSIDIQGEIWCWSLLGLKGLKVATFYRRLYGGGTNLTPTIPTSVKFSNFAELYLCSLKTFHFQTLQV